MKKMKKVMALLLSLVMVLAMSIATFATEGSTGSSTPKITAPNNGHEYEIYQIFTGDYSKGTLSNVKWGQNGTGTLGATVADDVITALTNVKDKTDREKLDVIKNYANLSNPVATIKDGNSYTGEAGYYLIKDKDGSVTGTNSSYTLYIVKVVGDITIQPKSDVPSFEKKVMDTNDTTAETSGWQDSADYDIGDDVPFQLKGTVSAKYDDYKTYYFAFHDVEEKGLTFNQSSVVVKVDGNKIDAGYDLVTSTTDGCTFEVVFNNLKNVTSVTAGSVITVEYTSKLNADAKLGQQGNVNKAKLEFSNNPNSEQEGKPDKPGETPWDNVIVFTYKVVVNKYANQISATTKLAGAEFTLKKKMKDGSFKDITVVKSEDGTSFTFSGLDDGEYILEETKTPAEYNTIAPMTFKVTANHDILWTTAKRTDVLTNLSGEKVSGEITLTPTDDKSTLSTDVINKSGSTLPTTGGMGTTIFYVVGSILVLGAAILLITKKRMSAR